MKKLLRKCFKYLPLFLRIKFYKDSDMKDINNRPILEGSIIKAKYITSWYGEFPDLKEYKELHCVEFYKGKFGSDVHSDFESLSQYDAIEVLGHVEQFRKVYFKDTEDELIGGNFGACIKY